jgi:hypothetical protein
MPWHTLTDILVVLLLKLSQVWGLLESSLLLFLFFCFFCFFFKFKFKFYYYFIESSTSAHSIQISLGI